MFRWVCSGAPWAVGVFLSAESGGCFPCPPFSILPNHRPSALPFLRDTLQDMAQPVNRYRGPGRTHPARIEAWLRAVKALELRRTGMPYRQIAWELHYPNADRARKAVLRVMMETAREPAEEVRQMEVERLDTLMAAHWQRALLSTDAAKLVLGIMERRARLLGLDAPKTFDITAWVREMAVKEGLDPEEAVRAAGDIVAMAASQSG